MAATDLEQLVIQLSADAKGMQNALRSAQSDTDKALARIERRFQQNNQKIASDMGKFARDVNTALATIGIGVLVKDASDLADAWTTAENKLKALGTAGTATTGKLKGLNQIAIDTRNGFEETVDLYAKVTRANEQLNLSEGSRLRLVETVNKALAVGGATATEAKSVVLQLGQALGSGVLGGDELRALRENSLVLAQAIAKEFGVTVGQLKVLGAEGKLTSDRVAKAIIGASAEIDRQFATSNSTIAASFTNLRNKLIETVGLMNNATGSGANLVDVINHVAENLDKFAEAALIAGAALLGGIAGHAVVLGLAAVTSELEAMAVGGLAATASVRGLQAAMAWVGGPLGLAITGLAIGMAAYATATSDAVIKMNAKREAAEKIGPIIKDLKKIDDELTTAQGDQAKKLHEARDALIDKANAELTAARNTLRHAEAIVELAAAEADRAETDPTDPRYGGFAAAGAEVARRNALVARARLRAMQQELQDGLPPLNVGVIVEPKAGGGGGGGGGDTPKAGKTIADLERQHQLTLAENDGNKLLVETLRDQEEIRRRTAEYQHAGLKTLEAEKRATTEVFAEREVAHARETFDAWADSMRDAFQIMDNAPNSITGVRAELERLETKLADVDAAGGHTEWVDSYIATLTELVARTGDVGEAMDLLMAQGDVSAEQVQRAAKAWHDAAAEFRIARDEALDRVIRVDEIRDDLKDAFHQALDDGSFGKHFGDVLLHAVERVRNRIADRLVDAIFDSSSVLSGGGGKKGGGLLNSLGNALFSGIGKLFGGGRASGGPVSPGMFYRVNENTPNSEFFAPNVPGQIIPAGALRMMQQPIPRSAQINTVSHSNVTVRIDLAGANGDAAIRQIARDESRRGVMEGLRVAEKNSPARNRRYELLGT